MEIDTMVVERRILNGLNIDTLGQRQMTTAHEGSSKRHYFDSNVSTTVTAATAADTTANRPSELFWTVEMTAKYLGISEGSVRRRLRKGMLIGHKVEINNVSVWRIQPLTCVSPTIELDICQNFSESTGKLQQSYETIASLQEHIQVQERIIETLMRNIHTPAWKKLVKWFTGFERK